MQMELGYNQLKNVVSIKTKCSTFLFKKVDAKAALLL